MSSQEIISRINALLNKTVENGCTVEEAASAAKIAQQLLTQHRLTVADLSTSEEKIHNNSEPLFVGKRKIHWKDKLAFGISASNGCKIYFHTVTVYRPGRVRYGHEVHCRIIGRDSDIQIVTYFFHYLEREIENLCKLAMKRGEGSGKTWSNSFKNGAADAVCRRLKEANQVTRTGNSTAIIKLNSMDEAVETWADKNLNLKPAPTKYVNYNDGYDNGKRAGENISLNRGISRTNQAKQLN